LLVVALYMMTGPALQLSNRAILRSGFEAPFFVSGIGMAATGLVTRVCVALGVLKVLPVSREKLPYTPVAIVAVASAAAIGCGNAAYITLAVPFIQMLKATTPVIVLAGLALTGVERISLPMGVLTVFISAGTALAAYGEANIVFIGVVFMVSSQFAEAARCVATQHFLQGLKLEVWDAAYYLAPPTGMCLLGMSLVWEHEKLLHLQWPSPWLLLFNSLLGLLLNVANYMMLKCTSSLMMKLIVIARDLLVVVWGVFVLQESVTTLQIVGYVVSLCAFTCLSLVKLGYLASPKSKGE